MLHVTPWPVKVRLYLVICATEPTGPHAMLCNLDDISKYISLFLQHWIHPFRSSAVMWRAGKNAACNRVLEGRSLQFSLCQSRRRYCHGNSPSYQLDQYRWNQDNRDALMNYLCIVMSEQNSWDVSTKERPLASDPISDFSGHENVQLVKCKHCMLSRQRNF